MIRVEKIGKGTYFEDAYKLSFKYDPRTVAKVKELAQRRYLPDDRAWEIPSYELPNLVEKVGISNRNLEKVSLELKNAELECRFGCYINNVNVEDIFRDAGGKMD